MFECLLEFAVLINGVLVFLGLTGREVNGHGFCVAFEGPLVIWAIGFVLARTRRIVPDYGSFGNGPLEDGAELGQLFGNAAVAPSHLLC